MFQVMKIHPDDVNAIGWHCDDARLLSTDSFVGPSTSYIIVEILYQDYDYDLEFEGKPQNLRLSMEDNR